MATHSIVLAWRIPWTEEPGGLPSLGSHRVGHVWSNLAAAAACCWPQGASLVAQRVRNLPVMQKTQVRPLCQENALEKGMTTHSSILVWEIPWTEEPGGLQSMGSQRIRHDWENNTLTHWCYWPLISHTHTHTTKHNSGLEESEFCTCQTPKTLTLGGMLCSDKNIRLIYSMFWKSSWDQEKHWAIAGMKKKKLSYLS